MSAEAETDQRLFVAVCPIERLTPLRGVAALIDGRAVAVFLLTDGEVVAFDNIDPCSDASVMSRGIIGDAAGIVTVASPMYKQRYDVRTGRCLDREGVTISVHSARVEHGIIQVALS